MESFWLFHINGVGIAAASTETYYIDNTPIKGISKMKEVKPGVLCSVIGPYEGVEKYMRFVDETIAVNPAITAEQLIEDIKWIDGKKEMDGNELKESMLTLTQLLGEAIEKIKENPDAIEEYQERIMEAEMRFQENPIMKLIEAEKAEGTDPTVSSRKVNQIRLIESLPDAFMTWGLSINESRATQMDYYEPHADPPLFNEWSLETFLPDNGPDSFGNKILRLRKEYLPKLKTFKQDIDTARHLRDMINQLDAEHNRHPAPLVFMQSAPYTGLRWVEFND